MASGADFFWLQGLLGPFPHQSGRLSRLRIAALLMRQVNMHEAKTHLSRLVEEAAAGEPFEIYLGASGALLLLGPGRLSFDAGSVAGHAR